jgi:hypothetical protein
MQTLNVEVPDYAWIAIKTRAAQEMVSVRHVIMSARTLSRKPSMVKLVEKTGK